MGVITTCRLDEGTVFGPVPPTMTLADPIVLIGHRTCDTLPDIHTVKLDVLSFCAGARLAEWVPYVQAARDVDEQNMEAVIDDGQLYFRVCRTVPANSELLIWYSDKLAARIGVPELRDDACFRGDRYYCSRCHENFMYPNCLRAHMRFRCKYRQTKLANTDQQETNNRKRPSDEATTAQTHWDVAPRCEHDAKLASKRKRPDDARDTSSPPKRSRTGTGSASQPEVNNRPRARSPVNGVVNLTVAADASAFQRVQLPPSPTSGPTLMTSATPTSGVNLAADGGAGLFLFPGLIGAAAAPRALSVGLAERMPTGFLADNELHPANGLNNNNNNDNDKNNANGNNKMAGVGGGNDGLGMVQHGTPDPRLAALPFVYSRAAQSNPVIDKMLNLFGSAAAVAAAAAGAGAAGGPLAATSSFPPLNLAQNWCAKCNTGFRMTSDLVYHMRSHHKREFDPVKRRKDDKLRCEVCGESFRERHHLTRHMTSHS